MTPPPPSSKSSFVSASKITIRRRRISRSKRAGVIFPVARIHRLLNQKVKRTAKLSSVFMAAVGEYLVAEILEIAGNVARKMNRKRIQPRHILFAIRRDEELDVLLKQIVLPAGGVIPHIHSVLFPKQSSVKQSKQQELNGQLEEEDEEENASI